MALHNTDCKNLTAYFSISEWLTHMSMLDDLLNRAYCLLKGAVRMAYPRSSASGSPGIARNLKATVTKAAARAKSNAPVLSYLAAYRASPLERIDMIRRGIPASEAKRICAELLIGQGAGFKALNLSTATVNKKARLGETLSPEESERIVGLAKLVGQLEAMIQDSGNPANFDARAWMARWLTEPLPAFGGIRPADLIDTMEGQGLVSVALAQIQSGAYA